MGVETVYYDPLIGSEIAQLIQDSTRLVFTESPGSNTFEIQDIPAIVNAAHERKTLVLMDNTWATPLFFKPFSHGVDVSIQAGTKYIAGHSDVVIGIISVRSESLYRQLKDTVTAFGEIAGPNDCFLALRGLRSMGVRLRHQQQAGLQIAQWLQRRPEVKRVLHPALPEDPGHDIWKRDFKGASSVFSVVFKTPSEAAIAHMVNGFRFFRIGASWGGFESLVIPVYPAKDRTAVQWTESGFVLRFHIGLETLDDLLDDLERGLERLNETEDKGIS
jgi:cystathionine beta-lyase